jgi:hypothetical protein
MTTERQRAANRVNARRSTGPKSPEGKRATRLNGLRHGILANAAVVIPGEDESAFEALRNAVHADLAPCGALENFLVDRIVNTMWRLQRLQRVEAALYHWRAYVLKARSLEEQARAYVETTTPGLELLQFSGETVITDEVSHARVTNELSCAEHERDRDEVLIGRALDADATDGNAFSKFARYENTIERALYRALHELQRVKAARQGRPTPLPAAVD